MNLFWQIAAILVSGAIGSIVSRRTLNRSSETRASSVPPGTLHIGFLIIFLLALPFFNVYLIAHPSLLWDFPWWFQVHYLSFFWGAISSILGYVFGFACLPGFVTNSRWKWSPIAFAASILATIQIYAWGNIRMDLPQVGEERQSKDGVILQTHPSTCVPAAAANIARLLGVRISEKELVSLCHTTKDGSYPGGSVAGLLPFGIQGRKARVTDNDIRTVTPPAMLFVLGDIHAIVYAGITNNQVVLLDPTSGKRMVSVNSLKQIWKGHAFEFSRIQ